MSAQTSYGFATQRGISGGLFDISPYAINTRLNEEVDGALAFGMGVVKGTSVGLQVKKPGATTTIADFEGITMNGFSTQQSIAGAVALQNNVGVGVLEWGKAWVLYAANALPGYGKDLYLIISGAEAGKFTTADDASTKIRVNGKWIGGKDPAAAIAPVELFAQTIDPSIPNNVTLSTAEADGTTTAVTSTKITLTFAQPILGLLASDITITDGTGAATKGALTKVSSTVYEIALSAVTTEGNVSVAVASPNGYIVSGSPKTVAVYKEA